jgi:CheY-like chemotaxis protein
MPTVVVADDHPDFLKLVCRELESRFNVLAAAGDGRRALAAATELDPDLVVLDISMPDLDGFETARELRRMGSRAKIVFLTLHHTDEYMVEAIGSSASGYVLKTCMKTDLVSTVEHALANRTCLPAVSPLACGDSCGHALLLYSHERTFFDASADFLSAALLRGDTVALPLSESGREGIARRIRDHGWDLDRLRNERRYVEFDSVEGASHVLRDGRVDVEYLSGFFDLLEETRLASPRGPQSRLTLCGAIAPLLCAAGKFEAALEVERTWDDLSRGRPYLTLCAYPLDCLQSGDVRAVLKSVCAEHAYVSDAGAGVWARAR